MAQSSPKLLILTLYCGETQFPAMCDALARQTFTHWEHTVFRDLPNVEAHNALYNTIMERACEFDYFIKLDADMVLSRPTALAEVMAFMTQRSGLDHAKFPVWDFFTQRLIPEVHVFSNRVHWLRNADAVFVDPTPTVPGYRIRQTGVPAPFVNHAPDPAPEQAFQFGVHRGLKAFQPDRARKRFVHAATHFGVLADAYAAYVAGGDRRHLLVVAGADAVAKARIGVSTSYKTDAAIQRVYDEIADEPDATIRSRLSRFWRSGLGRRMRLLRVLGRRGTAFYLRRFLRGRLGGRASSAPV